MGTEYHVAVTDRLGMLIEAALAKRSRRATSSRMQSVIIVAVAIAIGGASYFAWKTLPADRSIAELATILGHEFKRPELLERAVTHASAALETGESYQRLEFLGDRVLGLVMQLNDGLLPHLLP